MIATLITLAVIALIVALILSVSATFTVIYDNKWTTTVKILWYEREIKLSSILNFILFPDKAAHEARKKKNSKPSETKPNDKKADLKPAVGKTAEEKCNNSVEAKGDNADKAKSAEKSNSDNAKKPETKPQALKKESKPNYIKKLFDDDGIVGVLLLISNMFQSASSAINTLIRGFHIYSLYVKMIIGGGDAADIAQKYGSICSYYYPVKGFILNGMTVDEYDELFVPDFIAPKSEYGLQLIGSISVRLILKIVLSALKTFLVNMIQNNINNK